MEHIIIAGAAQYFYKRAEIIVEALTDLQTLIKSNSEKTKELLHCMNEVYTRQREEDKDKLNLMRLNIRAQFDFSSQLREFRSELENDWEILMELAFEAEKRYVQVYGLNNESISNSSLESSEVFVADGYWSDGESIADGEYQDIGYLHKKYLLGFCYNKK